MNEAKALRQVELLARIVATYRDEPELRGVYRWDGGYVASLRQTVADLRLALVELDIARSENAPSIYERT